MPKFTPLSLHAYSNAGRDNAPLTAGGSAPWQKETSAMLTGLPKGSQLFWGVPFELLAGDSAPAWIVLGPDNQLADIPLPAGTTASYVVVAHFCNGSRDGVVHGSRQMWLNPVMRPGEHVADYVLRYADGSEHSQPIRRRFEINELTAMWGQLAFAARPSITQEPADPLGDSGRGEWGRNQTALADIPTGSIQYWVYALPNPHPERALAGIRLAATGADNLAVAAITLFHGKDHPLRHKQLETVRVTLPSGDDTPADGIAASIDLGVVARRYSVPAFLPEQWLAAQPKGWGEEPQAAGTDHKVMVDITASPDATLKVGRHSVDMRPLYEHGKAQAASGASVEWLTPERTWVHVSILDDATGSPTPVRVHFRAGDGRYLPPYGHRHQVNDNWFEDYGGDLKLGSTEYAYVDGRFQIELPVGECYVELSKGFEYEPVRQKLQIQPGQRELTLRLKRQLNLRKQGWMTADTHVHFISPQTAWLEGQAEGLNLINLLASQWGDLFTNVADITGELSGCSRGDTIVWVGTENRQHLLGHMSLLGVNGQPVYPMCSAGPSESFLGDPAHSSLVEWAERCRQQEGVVVIPHFPTPYAEVVAGLILGKIDGVEVRDFYIPAMSTFSVQEWYRFLNLGYRVAAVGGTDKMSAGMPVGGVRTYARLGDEEFTFANWAKAVRAGRTFTTSGPVIDLQVEGKGMGEAIALPAGGGTLEAQAHAQSVSPFHVLQIIVNGKVVAEEKDEAGTCDAHVATKVRVSGSSWVAARCLSMLKVWHCWPIHMAAHTSPVYVTVDGAEQFSPSDATYMLTLLDGGLTWLDTLSVPASPARQARVRAGLEQAKHDLEHRLQTHGHRHS